MYLTMFDFWCFIFVAFVLGLFISGKLWELRYIRYLHTGDLKIIKGKNIKVGDILRHWNKDIKVQCIERTSQIELNRLECVEKDHLTEEWLDSRFILYTKWDDPHIKVLT